MSQRTRPLPPYHFVADALIVTMDAPCGLLRVHTKHGEHVFEARQFRFKGEVALPSDRVTLFGAPDGVIMIAKALPDLDSISSSLGPDPEPFQDLTEVR